MGEMDIQIIGPWVLLGVGVLTLIGALWVTVRQIAPRRSWILWVFGFAIAGVGAYGPLFLKPYGEFLDVVFRMQDSPGPDTHKEVFKMIGDRQVPPKYQKLALAYALENPVEGMDELLEKAIENSTDPRGKQALVIAQESLKGKKKLADELSTLGGLKQKIKKLIPVTQHLIKP